MQNKDKFRKLVGALQKRADDGLLNQAGALWDRDDPPCCVGAYAVAWLDGLTFPADYSDAPMELARLLGGTPYQIVQMLREAGAPFDPFGKESWDYNRVFANLTLVEELPPDNKEFGDATREQISLCLTADADRAEALDSLRTFLSSNLGATTAWIIADRIDFGQSVPGYWEE